MTLPPTARLVCLLDVELKTFAVDAGEVVDNPDIWMGGGP